MCIERMGRTEYSIARTAPKKGVDVSLCTMGIHESRSLHPVPPMTDSNATSVLIVDDDPWVTLALTQLLSAEEGISVAPPACSGETAIDVYRAATPDVVLMDLSMPPGMTGIEATQQIRRFDPNARIVILTTTAPGPGLARAIHAGAMAVIDKTAPPRVVVEAVRAAAAFEEDPLLLRGLMAEIQLSGDLPPAHHTHLPQLTPTELDTLHLICAGNSYEEMSRELGVAVSTVKTHASHLREKLQAENFAGLILRALEYKFISL